MGFEELPVDPFSHPSLFDDDLRPPARTLVIRPTATRPLSKLEKAFNRALERVRKLGVRLEEEKQRLDQALVFHAAEVRPRIECAVTLRTQLALALAPFLEDRRVNQRDRAVLHAILVDQLNEILSNAEHPGAEVQALFERLHGLAYTEAVQEDMDAMRSDIEAMFGELGVDVGVPDLRPDMSEEEVAAATARFADDMRRAAEGARGDVPNRRKTKRELREEDQAERAAELRKNSIGAVYKRLVKALHPDLESNPVERESKIRMMQDVTVAYRRGDLHTLLRLELEWIGGAHADTARLTDEKLRAYTEVLKEQAAELEAECIELRFHPRYAPLLMDGPLGLALVVDGPREVGRLEHVIETLRIGLESVTSGQALHAVRRAIKEYRQARKGQRLSGG
jgi:hypothetical protein